MIRVLYYYPNYNNMMFQWQKYHIFDELASHDCRFEIISPFDYNTIEDANNAIVERVRKSHYDVFMSSYNVDFLFIETLNEIKKNGTATLCFCPDNLTVPFNKEGIAEYYDLVWLTSKETEYIYRKWGANTIFQPYAANPSLLNPNFSMKEINRLAFIGTPHGSRIDRINYLIKAGIPMTVYANQVDTNHVSFQATIPDYVRSFYNYARFPIGRKLMYATIKEKFERHFIDSSASNLISLDPVGITEMGLLNNQYALVLAFTEAGSTGVLKKPVPIVNLRNFEIPMSGGIEITTFTEEMATYFEPGKEIILCQSKEEIIEKAKYYLDDKRRNERQAIKHAARRRAECEHTWYHRFVKIFDAFGLKL